MQAVVYVLVFRNATLTMALPKVFDYYMRLPCKQNASAKITLCVGVRLRVACITQVACKGNYNMH